MIFQHKINIKQDIEIKYHEIYFMFWPLSLLLLHDTLQPAGRHCTAQLTANFTTIKLKISGTNKELCRQLLIDRA